MGTSLRPDDAALVKRISALRKAGASEQEIDDFLSEAAGPAKPKSSVGRNLVGAAAQLGMNWGDEIAGGVAAAGAMLPGGRSPKQAYDATQQYVEKAGDDFYQSHKPLAIGMQIGSALLPIGAGARAASVAGKLGRMAAPAMGAATGAVVGAGRGEDIGDRAGNAAVGGVVGGVGAAVLSPIAQALLKSKPGAALANRLSAARGKAAPVTAATTTPRDKALKIVAKKLLDDGVDAGAVDAAVKAARAGDPDLLLNLGGENTAAFTRVVQSIPGRGKSVVQSALDRQAMEVPELVTRGVEDAIGKPIPNAVSRVQELADDAARAAKPRYDAIRNVVIEENDALADVLQRPAVKDAMRAARTNILNRGKNLPEYEAWSVRPSAITDKGGVPLSVPQKVKRRATTAGMLDDAKKVLDAQIESVDEKIASGRASGADKASIHGLRDARRALIDLADQATNADYARARAVAAQGIGKREAFRSGTKALTRRADDLETELAVLPAGNRSHMLEGAATDLQERVTSRNPTNASSVFDPKARRNLDLITEGTPAQQTIRDTYQRAQKLNQQARASTMRGQSTTASTTRGQVDLEDAVGGLESALNAGGKALTGRWYSLAADAIRAAAARRLRGVTTDVAGEAADILTQRLGGQGSRELVEALIERSLREQASKATAVTRRIGVGRTAGTVAGGRR